MDNTSTGTGEGKVSALTRWTYGLGCIGRDANYTLFSNFLLTYLTLAVGLLDWQLGVLGIVFFVGRIWDGINDPMMGIIIDNTKTRWGKFKPYIIIGALTNSVCTILLFSGLVDPSVNWTLFLVIFCASYLLWDITFTMNDIGYWSMLPALTTDPKERIRVSSLARIGANIGLFAATALVPLFTSMGRLSETYRLIAWVVAGLFIACQLMVVLCVTEQHSAITNAESKVKWKDALKIIFKNDQLLAIMASILLFNIGYFITTSFGLQFFYFDYGHYGGNEFTIFALALGLSQVLALVVYPQLAKRFSRRQLFTGSICMVVLGYLGFMAVGFLLPMNMISLCIVGFILFAGQAVIMALTVVMLADTVEYGQWKLGTRNEGILFSLNPLIVKFASAVQALVWSATMVFSGLNTYSNQIADLEKDASLTKEQILVLGNEIVQNIPKQATLVMRLSMIILPLLLILAGYLVYMKKFKIDSEMYEKIMVDLQQRAGETPPAIPADS